MTEIASRRLTLKIALGVFLGVIMALLVWSVPGWVRKKEAERKQKADLNVEVLTPRHLIAQCGEPLKDKTTKARFGDDMVWLTRDITIQNSRGIKATLEFEAAAMGKHEKLVWILKRIGLLSVGENPDQMALLPAKKNLDILEANFVCASE